MTLELAERRIKAIQKEILVALEHHDVFYALDPATFNRLRKQVFKGTFSAYRVGVVGLSGHAEELHKVFLSAIDDEILTGLAPKLYEEVFYLVLFAVLQSFRVGAMVAAAKEMS